MVMPSYMREEGQAMQRSLRQLVRFAAVSLVMLAMAGCGSLKKAKSSVGKSGESKKPKENIVCASTTGKCGTTAARTYLQSRDVLELTIDQSLFASTYYISLYNSTSGTSLIKREPTDSTNQKTGFAFSLLGDDKVSMKIFPKDFSLSGGMNYGENKLMIYLDDNVATGAEDTESIYLVDFEVFSEAASSFPDNQQVSYSTSGYFQGWVNTLSSPQVLTGEQTITTGMFNMINL